MFRYKGQWALVTGASSGIGESFVRQLAAQGMNIILVARSEDQMNAIAKDVSSRFQVQTTVIPQDLSLAGAAEQLFNKIKTLNIEVHLLVNNAGFGMSGEIQSNDLGKLRDQIQVNITSLVELCHLFLPQMYARQNGAIINVASIVSFMPLPYASTYAASKSFVFSFSQAINREAAKYGVLVLALCPGTVNTQFFQKLGTNPSHLDSPDSVVEQAITALESNKSFVVAAQLQTQIMLSAIRFLPREIVARIGEIIAKSYLVPKNKK